MFVWFVEVKGLEFPIRKKFDLLNVDVNDE